MDKTSEAYTTAEHKQDPAHFYTPQPPAYPGHPETPTPAPDQQGHAQPQQRAYGMKAVSPQDIGSFGYYFNEYPRRMNCPNCGADIITSTQPVIGVFTFVIMMVLFLFTLGICFLLPLCISSCKDVNHCCPNCHCHLGSYKRM